MSSVGEASGGAATAVKSEIKKIKSLKSEVLDLPPSCLEFSTKYPDYFVVGTYYLEKEEELEDDTSKEKALANELEQLALQDGDVTAKDDLNASGKAPATSQNRSGSLLLYQVRNEEL